jgi:hypothetical protein
MKRLTKSQYEVVATILKVQIQDVMSQEMDQRGTRGKANLQDLVAGFADTFQAADTEFDRRKFYQQSGAMDYLI